MIRKKVSKKLECLKRMPPVQHSTEGEKFSYEKSQLVAWLLKQNTILDWLCQCVFNSGYVSYNSCSKTWQGINNHDIPEHCEQCCGRRECFDD